MTETLLSIVVSVGLAKICARLASWSMRKSKPTDSLLAANTNPP